MNLSDLQRMVREGDLSLAALRYLIDCGAECEWLDYKERFGFGDRKTNPAKHDFAVAEFARDALAMANSGGGYLVIGVEDKTWRPVGIGARLDYDGKELRDKVKKGCGQDLDVDVVHHRTGYDGVERLFAVIFVRGLPANRRPHAPYVVSHDYPQGVPKPLYRTGEIYARRGDSTAKIDSREMLERLLLKIDKRATADAAAADAAGGHAAGIDARHVSGTQMGTTVHHHYYPPGAKSSAPPPAGIGTHRSDAPPTPASQLPRHRFRFLARRWRWIALGAVILVVAPVVTVVMTRSTKAAEVPTIYLADHADRATWTSGAGEITFGHDGQERGRASHNRTTFEDGRQAGGVLTHPNWEDDGYIRGCFTLPRQVHNTDHFRATVGFPDWADTGDVRFQVDIVDQHGTPTRIIDVPDRRTDGELRPLDKSLATHAGSDTICLQVTANGDSGQDAAFWLDPRIGPAR